MEDGRGLDVIKVYFCDGCGYGSFASWIGKELEKRLLCRVVLVRVENREGALDVEFNGEVVFSKDTANAFPDENALELLMIGKGVKKRSQI